MLRRDVSFSNWGRLGDGDDESKAGDDGGLHDLVMVLTGRDGSLTKNENDVLGWI